MNESVEAVRSSSHEVAMPHAEEVGEASERGVRSVKVKGNLRQKALSGGNMKQIEWETHHC